jgi:MobC-like protein
MEQLKQPTKTNKGGRPRKLDDEFRGYTCAVSLNEKENSRLIERAESVGLGALKMRASFIRKLIMNAKINSISPISKDALVELNRIGQNLNQLAKLANSNHVAKTNLAIDPSQINQIHADIKSIGQNLLGVQDE